MKNSRNKTIIWALTAAVLGGGCAKNSEPELRPDRPIAIHTTVTSTKAPMVDGPTNKAPLTGLHLLYNLDSPAFGATTPIVCSRSTAGLIVFPSGSELLYDKVTNQTAHFLAYWPTTTAAVITPTQKVVWTIDGKTDILITRPWNAGSYMSPAKDFMKIDHQLAQLEVICRAEGGASPEIINALWGKLQKVEVIATLPTATLVYATDFVTNPDAEVVAYSGTPADKALLKADYETEYTPQDIPGYLSTTPLVAMLAPSEGPIKLRIVTEGPSRPDGTIDGIEQLITVQLKDANGTEVDFEVGKKHSIVINFKAMSRDIYFSGVTILPWGTGYYDQEDKPI